jgi:hypothetical protein
VKKRSEDKRNRDLGWTPINTKFDGSVGHHLLYNGEYNKDVGIGIYIPKGLHTIGHGRKNPIK